ncbi:MAG TPA: hypothetical protein VEQ18_04165 [Candidatus Nitrosocosmicus sp.]|nr:hypothetical protein [Candidatus Nitrosocosmicus sp.]
MHIRDFSVPQAVKEIITSNDFYFKAIKSGIIIYTAIANKIHKDVESLIDSNVNIGTIIVAIKRFADDLYKNDNYSLSKNNNSDSDSNYDVNDPKKIDFSMSPNDVRMTLTGSMIDINFNNDTMIKDISDIIYDFSKDTFFEYNLIHTAKKMCIFTEDIQESRKTILDLKEKYNGKITEGLSKITLTLSSEDIIFTRQILYHIFDMINNYKITINNAFFTNKEIILILGGSEAAKTYDLLRRKLFSNK